MPITIHVDSSTPPEELNAIAALIAALGGRAGPIAVALAEEATRGPGVKGSIGTNSQDAANAPNTYSANAPLPQANVPLAPAPDAVPPAPPASDTVQHVSPPPPAPMPGVDLDSEGLPWDARIHGENRSQTQNGRWKRKRNTPDDLWEQVRAELRNAMGAPAAHSVAPDSPLAAPYAIAPASEPSAAEAFAPSPFPVAPPPPPAPPAPAATESPAAAASSAADAFTDLLTRVVARQGAGEITTEQVAEAAKAVGLNGIRDLMVRPDLIASFEMVLG